MQLAASRQPRHVASAPSKAKPIHGEMEDGSLRMHSPLGPGDLVETREHPVELHLCSHLLSRKEGEYMEDPQCCSNGVILLEV
jgi:hypothetical protein